MIDVGIVDDHAIVRSGLKQFLTEHDDLHVVGEAGNGREALELVRKQKIDVLLLDLAMPDRNGIETLHRIRPRAPATAILILSGYPEEHYATNLIRLGANGYLNKTCNPTEIVDAIRTVASGRRYLTPAVSELIAEKLAAPSTGLPHEQLTRREFQVFIRCARGAAHEDIARELCVSPKTLTIHRTRVLKKLGLSNNSELTYYAMKNKLIE